MYLKSVEMQGFKSFADKIYLDFNPGITAIVGPNGSGKSNISDAIRWVMGEQSIKSLRGSRMEDVIFSGTEVRKPQGFAEVSLVLDNSEGIFPVDYEEVTVTRRVYRSGEGEYFINRNACRLKDIHELFMDTGLGREGYSIIGQGKIDEILSNKSEDRRRIFEEAAGITKYKYRKNEAEKKLERTNDNLTRVTDIMTELEGQLEPLRIQSEKAKKYLNLREELKGIEVNAAVVTIEKHREDLKTADAEYDAVSESIDIMQKETEQTESTINDLYSKIAEYDNEKEELRRTKEETVEKTSDGANSINLSL
ncbi:MAG: AAA family ATPase, partial [Clostridia bacterium]|nr:AAA family ATPase [Clostridia bacterium]